MEATAPWAGDEEYEFDVFISYRQGDLDGEVALRLRELLERYRPPAKAAAPRRTVHAFLDVGDLAATARLTDTISRNLARSRFLLVICSTRSIESPWVREEVAAFRRLDRGDRILALWLDGDRRTVVDPLLSPETLAISIGADTRRKVFRRMEEEKLRLLAPLLDCEYDELRRRDDERRIRRLRAIAAASTALVLALASLSWGLRVQTVEAKRQRALAEARLVEALGAVDRVLFTIDTGLEPVAGAAGVRKSLLDDATGLLEELGVDAQDRPQRLVALMTAHQHRGDVALDHDRVAEAEKEYRAALRLAEAMYRAAPDERPMRAGLALALSKLAEALIAAGRIDEARTAALRSLSERAELAALAPGDAAATRELLAVHVTLAAIEKDARRWTDVRRHLDEALALVAKLGARAAAADRATVHTLRGEAAVAAGKTEEAIAEYRRSLDAARTAAAAAPGDAALQRAQATTEISLADALGSSGATAEALIHRTSARRVLEDLAARDATNIRLRIDLAMALDREGDALRASDPRAAADVYRRSRDQLRNAVAADPGDVAARRGLGVACDKEGGMALAGGDVAGAARAYREALLLREELRRADPGQARYQRDLSVSHEKLGDVARATGDFATAATEYESCRVLRAELLTREPGDADRRRDLSVIYNRTADLADASGRLDDAAHAYSADLALTEQIAASVPDDPETQRDLLISHAHLADVLRRLGARTAWSKHRDAGLAIAGKLAAAGRFTDDAVVAQMVDFLRKLR